MTKHVLFIHGGGGGAYEADAALAQSLRDALGEGYRVRYPRMPHDEEPDYETWKRIILDAIAEIGEGALLVGHSIGASVLIKVLTTVTPPAKLGCVVLIAPPFWHDDQVWHWDEVALSKDAGARYPSDAPLHIFRGDADETVPATHLTLYADVFKFAVLHRLPRRDHQLNDDMTEVARVIAQAAVSL